MWREGNAEGTLGSACRGCDGPLGKDVGAGTRGDRGDRQREWAGSPSDMVAEKAEVPISPPVAQGMVKRDQEKAP
jgi:hypothetical protein